MSLILKKCRFAALLLVIILSGCMQQVQQQLDRHDRILTNLQQRAQGTGKTIAGFENELDRIRREIQTLRGSIEENAYSSKNEISDLQNKLDQLSVTCKQVQTQLEQQRNTQPNPDKKTAIKSIPAAPEANAASEEQQLYDQAYSKFKEKKFKSSRLLFEKFMSKFPQSKLSDNAQYWRGNCFFKEKNNERAIAAFDDVIKNFPNGNKIPDAYYLQALSFLAIDDSLSAQLLLETPIQKYPSSKAAALAKKKYDQLKDTNPP